MCSRRSTPRCSSAGPAPPSPRWSGIAREIDRINVFPVADRDTGTNLLLTMGAAEAELRSGRSRAAEATRPGSAAGRAGQLRSDPLPGAARRGGGRGGGARARAQGTVLADALARGARLAEKAVTRPQEGTMLTVLAAAADGAAAAGSDRLDAVAVAAAEAAATALRATPDQLPELARAGVVDAGGLGLVVVLDALAAAGHRPGAGSASRQARGGGTPRRRPRRPGEPGATADYEVMYLLDGSDDARAAALRAALDGIGDAVAVVGDGAAGGTGTWNVHVHCADIGAALEAGMTAGRPHGVRVEPLAEPRTAASPAPARCSRWSAGRRSRRWPGRPARTSWCATARLRACRPTDVDETLLVGALAGTGARHVVLLGCDAALTPVAERAAAGARRAGQEVVVVPTASVVAGSGGAGGARPRPARRRRRRRDDRGRGGHPLGSAAGRRSRRAHLGRPVRAR